jgi:hypothetical protein
MKQANATNASLSEASELAEIKRLHTRIMSNARMCLTDAIELGGLLTTKKKKLKHGEWGKWQKNNLPFSQRTANSYMRCYDNRDDPKLETIANLKQAYQLLEGRSTRKKGGSTQRRVKQDESMSNVESQNQAKPIKNAETLDLGEKRLVELAVKQAADQLWVQAMSRFSKIGRIYFTEGLKAALDKLVSKKLLKQPEMLKQVSATLTKVIGERRSNGQEN